jgi:hypothetical protein
MRKFAHDAPYVLTIFHVEVSFGFVEQECAGILAITMAR